MQAREAVASALLKKFDIAGETQALFLSWRVDRVAPVGAPAPRRVGMRELELQALDARRAGDIALLVEVGDAAGVQPIADSAIVVVLRDAAVFNVDVRFRRQLRRQRRLADLAGRDQHGHHREPGGGEAGAKPQRRRRMPGKAAEVAWPADQRWRGHLPCANSSKSQISRTAPRPPPSDAT